MTRIKTASALTATAAALLIGGGLATQAIGGREGGSESQGGAPQAAQSQPVPPAPREPDVIAPADAANHPLQIPVGNDALLEVVAVSDGQRFWTADGLPLDQPAFDVPPSNVPLHDGLRRIYIKLAMRGEIHAGDLPADLREPSPGTDRRIAVAGAAAGGGGSFPTVGDEQMLIVWRDVGPGQVTTRLALRVAVEPWRVRLLVPVGGDVADGYATAGILPQGSLFVTPLAGVPYVWLPDNPEDSRESTAPRRSQVTVVTNQRNFDIQPVFRDGAGSWHRGSGGRYPLSEELYVRTWVAEVPPHEVTRLGVLVRPMHRVEVDVVTVPEPQPGMALRRVVTPPPRLAEGVADGVRE